MSDEYGYEVSAGGRYRRKDGPGEDDGSNGPLRCSYPQCSKRGKCKVSNPTGWQAVYCYRHTVAYVKSVIHNVGNLNHSIYIQRAPGVEPRKKPSGKVFG